MSDTNPVMYEIRESCIHNKGVFSLLDIDRGTYILQYIGEKITKKEADRRGVAKLEESRKTGGPSVLIFELNRRYDIDGDMPGNDAKFINHSCAPNCEAVIWKKEIWIVARRAIKKGEELTFDYGYDVSFYQDHPCLCGSKNCVGYIVSRKQWKKLRKILAAQSQ